MDNTKKFSRKADAYCSARPAYATAFIEELYSKYGFNNNSVIADIGSGTGILTKQLLDNGSTVYAVEPNGQMRVKAETALKSYNNFHSVNGTAENTELKDGSVDFITVAQAFHWFDIEPFKKECKRILKGDGRIFLIWNMRDSSSEISTEQSEICKKYCPDFTGFNGGNRNDEEKISLFFGGKFTRKEYDNPLFYDREKFIKRALSSSYSLNENDENFAQYLKELNILFDKYSKDGFLSVPNKTEVYFN